MITIKQMKKEDYQEGGKNLIISYSFFKNGYGTFLVASTEEGICNLLIGDNQSEVLDDLEKRWTQASLFKKKKIEHQEVENFFNDKNQKITLFLKGTDFQLQVWQNAKAIPKGKIIPYKDIAQKIGHPRAVRAVGSALANNPVAYIIACHRVKSLSGKKDNYRWGIRRKACMLKDEVAERANKR